MEPIITIQTVIRTMMNTYNSEKLSGQVKISEDTIIGLLSSPVFGDFLNCRISLDELIQEARKREKRKE